LEKAWMLLLAYKPARVKGSAASHACADPR
jgi:hypothetical protein